MIAFTGFNNTTMLPYVPFLESYLGVAVLSVFLGFIILPLAFSWGTISAILLFLNALLNFGLHVFKRGDSTDEEGLPRYSIPLFAK